jgi:glutathione S-transferase
MSLKLYYHPLASFCWKALIALYETGAPFKPHLVDLGNPEARAEFLKVWPIGKFPVLHDEAKDLTIPESTIIIEYLARHYPGDATLLPTNGELAWQTRLKDRFYDLYVHEPMQKVVTDRLRPAGMHDPHGVESARAQLATSYAMIEREMANRSWAMGDSFGMADCAASPALFYANKVAPFGDGHPNIALYLNRLMERPSFARVLEEAKPYFKMFPEQNGAN